MKSMNFKQLLGKNMSINNELCVKLFWPWQNFLLSLLPLCDNLHQSWLCVNLVWNAMEERSNTGFESHISRGFLDTSPFKVYPFEKAAFRPSPRSQVFFPLHKTNPVFLQVQCFFHARNISAVRVKLFSLHHQLFCLVFNGG